MKLDHLKPLLLIGMKAVFIIGPSGSGKTTLASHLTDMHRNFFGPASAISVNLDCANEGLEEVDA